MRTKNFIFIFVIILISSINFVLADDWSTNFTSGTFGGATNMYNNMIAVNGTHYLIAYHGGSGAGYVRSFIVNSTYGVNTGDALRFVYTYGIILYLKMAKINDTHYIVAYSDSNSNGNIDGAILELLSNGTVITKSTETLIASNEGGTSAYIGDINSIDTNTFLVLYTVQSSQYARVIKAYANGTITNTPSGVNLSSGSGLGALEMIDSNHYLATYQGAGGDTYAQVVTAYTNGTVVAGTNFKFKNYDAYSTTDLAQIDSTHYLNIQRMTANILGVYTNNWTVYVLGSNLTYFDGAGMENTGMAVKRMNNNQFVAMYGGYYGSYLGYYPGYLTTINVNTSAWTLSAGTPYLFTGTSGGNHDDIEKIDNTHYVGAYQSSTNGYLKVFNFIGTILDSCSCPGLNQNWALDLTKYCVITSACDLGTGLLSFTGAGNATFSARVDALNMTAPGSGGTLYITSTGSIYLG